MKYIIPTYKIKTILKKINELNNRIEGMEGTRIDYTVSPAYDMIIKDMVNDVIVDKLTSVIDLNIINPVVSLNGWTFLAVLEHAKNGNVILKKIYDIEVPEKYWTSDSYCEHCNTNRYRKHTYLVYKKETNEIFQIGSTCLTAYLGFDVSLLLAHAKLFDNLNTLMDKEKGKMGQRGIETQPFELFLKRTIVYVNKYGYISAKKVREMSTQENPLSPTGYDVWNIQYDKYKSDFDKLIDNNINTLYDDIIKWLDELELTSDYIRNIRLIKDREYVTYKTATTASSIVGVCFMNLQKKNLENKKISNHFGNIKDKLDITMTLTGVRTFDTRYGTSNCYTFETEDGNIAVWFTNSVQLDIDKKYTGKITVKEHIEYKGVKKTVVTRCKLKEI